MSVSERIAGRTLPLVGIGRSKLTLGDLVQYLCGLLLQENGLHVCVFAAVPILHCHILIIVVTDQFCDLVLLPPRTCWMTTALACEFDLLEV